jgi:hypothetical protein
MSNGHYIMQFSGSYAAAIAGFNIENNFDDLFFRFQRAIDHQGALAGFRVAYGFGNPTRIIAPSTVDPWEAYSVNADLLDPTFVPPVTYSWTDEGSPLSYTSDYFDVPGQPPGTNHLYEVTISDSQNHSVTTQFLVHTRTCYAPCNES